MKQKKQIKPSRISKPAGNSLIVINGLIFITGFIAPFVHIFFSDSKRTNIFGFQYLDDFLSAVGLPYFIVVISWVLQLAGKRVERALRPFFRMVSFLTAFVGLFFLIQALSPSIDDYDHSFYYPSMVLCALAAAAAMQFLQPYGEGLVRQIRMLRRFMVIEVKKKHITPEKEPEYNASYIKNLKRINPKFLGRDHLDKETYLEVSKAMSEQVKEAKDGFNQAIKTWVEDKR